MERGGSSERCLKWGGEGGGSLRDLSKNILEQGVGKGKSCSYGGRGFLSCHYPCPRKLLIIHQKIFPQHLETELVNYQKKKKK